MEGLAGKRKLIIKAAMRKLAVNFKREIFIRCFLNEQANLTSHTVSVFPVNLHKCVRNALLGETRSPSSPLFGLKE